MKHKSFTLKLDKELYSALSSLSSVVHRSIDQLITDAVSMYVMQKSSTVEQGTDLDLETTVQRIRQYATGDPKFEHAIAAFADAETRYKDPVEGTLVAPAKNIAHTKIREIINEA